MALHALGLAILLASSGFFALAFGLHGQPIGYLPALVNVLLGFAALKSEQRSSYWSSLMLVLATAAASWGALINANSFLLGLAVIATLIFWVCVRASSADRLLSVVSRLGGLALLYTASSALALYLPVTLSFPMALTLASLGAGALLFGLRCASRV
ncbi:MAG: hypothetical protein A2Z21_09690 [Candidatus Fraserbacteria bacterium RBG_16_55_9]|uniref:Uncharacterized protein n=1 Tax=Fraserbacteria sp. (strain RBG_16_55_9) TaxID=1817864 RepID=A0A1F5UQ45_FRAXR|nr:MAG: hypothetical protein A2Z21_09690 [Candidatus Fraserbacteria bacterium RBG_16_55_9]